MTKKSTLQQLSVKSLDSDGEKSVVQAILTAPIPDGDGEVYDTHSMQVPLRGGGSKRASELDGTEELNIPFVTNHDLKTGGINVDVRETIGKVIRGKLNEAGEFVVDLFFSSIKEAQDMYTLVKEGCLDDCLSLVYWHYGASEDGVIYNAEPFQLGVVWKSSNERARVMAKSMSLKERNDVTKVDVEAKKKELAAKQAEVEALETEVQEAEAAGVAEDGKQENQNEEQSENKETQAEAEKAEEARKAKEAEEAQAKADADAEEKRKTEEAEAARKKEEEKEVTAKEVAAKAAASAPNGDVKQEQTNINDTKDTRELAVKSLRALRDGDFSQVRSMTKKLAAKAAGRGAYEDITGEDTEVSILSAQIDNDARKLYEESGGLASRVTKKHLNGSNTEYKFRKKSGRFVFKPAPYGSAKEVQHIAPVYESVKVQPWAVIAAWDEEAAEDTPYDYYADVTADLGDGALFNEEFLIMGFGGGTFGGRTYAATGILPILKTAGNRSEQYVADSTFPAKLAAAMGKVVSTTRNARIDLVMTRATRATLAGIADADGRLMFTGGNNIDLGLMGSVDIVEVDESILPDGQIVVGDLTQYVSVEKGGLKLLASQHATIDGVSLYQTDGEALRARQRLAGAPYFNESFYVLTLGTTITVPAIPTVDGAAS